MTFIFCNCPFFTFWQKEKKVIHASLEELQEHVPFWTRGRNGCSIVPEGYVHFARDVILFAYGVTYFQQRVILEQNFVNPTHVIKNEIQYKIWTV